MPVQCCTSAVSVGCKMDWLLPGEFTRCSVYECCLYCVKQWWPCFLSSILKGKHLRHSGSLAAPPSLMWYTMKKVPEAGAQTIHCGQEWSYVRYSVTAMSAFQKETWEKLTWMVHAVLGSWQAEREAWATLSVSLICTYMGKAISWENRSMPLAATVTGEHTHLHGCIICPSWPSIPYALP